MRKVAVTRLGLEELAEQFRSSAGSVFHGPTWGPGSKMLCSGGLHAG
jgi:hypothetical protein